MAVRLDAGLGDGAGGQLGVALLPQVRRQVAGGARRRAGDHARSQPRVRRQRPPSAPLLQGMTHI